MTYEQFMLIKTLLLERISEMQSAVDAERRYAMNRIGRSRWLQRIRDAQDSMSALQELYNTQGGKKNGAE